MTLLDSDDATRDALVGGATARCARRPRRAAAAAALATDAAAASVHPPILTVPDQECNVRVVLLQAQVPSPFSVDCYNFMPPSARQRLKVVWLLSIHALMSVESKQSAARGQVRSGVHPVGGQPRHRVCARTCSLSSHPSAVTQHSAFDSAGAWPLRCLVCAGTSGFASPTASLTRCVLILTTQCKPEIPSHRSSKRCL